MKAYLVSDAGGDPLRVIRLPDDADPQEQLVSGETCAPYDPATAPPLVVAPDVPVIDEASILARLDREREEAQMKVLTAGGAKKYVYNRKAAEAIDSRSLTTVLLNALSVLDKQRRFPFAYAEAQLTGETIAAVLARFEAGLTASSTKIAAIEAQAQKAKRAVRAATTNAAKQAAAQVSWIS